MKLLSEFAWFVTHRKGWWILPILVALAFLVVLAWMVARAPSTPFIYRL